MSAIIQRPSFHSGEKTRRAAAGAKRFAEEPVPRLTLRMFTEHSVDYEVHHTQMPVFDLKNADLAELLAGRPVLIVVDESLWSAHAREIEAYAHHRLECRGIMQIAAGESTKSLALASTLCEAAIDARIPRDGIFLAIGGGTIMDVVGFAASIFRRGIGYVRVPTTLIGMIDVAVGIKQGVNLGRKKNIIGSFYPPLGIVNDQRFLATLPRRHLACGVSEAVKVGLVCDERLFLLLESYAPALIGSGFQRPIAVTQEILRRSEAVMIEQLSLDLHEVTRRRLVDFGHTFSPTIESFSDYVVPHGEAVAIDMLLSSLLGVRAGVTPALLPERLASLFHAVDLPLTHPTMTVDLMRCALEETRLHRDGNLNLVVPVGIGEGTFLQDVSSDDLADVLAAVGRLQTAA